MTRLRAMLTAPILAALAPAPAAAQQPAAPAAPLAVGTVAPDFTLPGATRYGVLKAPIHLSDFKGKTVVLAFFYKARTKG
jgi:cytochrome oxidase Cu insertion factor (SCO1/SenC/PrrC family)